MPSLFLQSRMGSVYIVALPTSSSSSSSTAFAHSSAPQSLSFCCQLFQPLSQLQLRPKIIISKVLFKLASREPLHLPLLSIVSTFISATIAAQDHHLKSTFQIVFSRTVTFATIVAPDYHLKKYFSDCPLKDPHIFHSRGPRCPSKPPICSISWCCSPGPASLIPHGRALCFHRSSPAEKYWLSS